ncbi:MAG: sigma-70 family RNA polymerase sigma factor [Acidobacteria bacterium]|nr:sigma-70 family RNA polymerase sigma factor [Acidobacteriota bacterium]
MSARSESAIPSPSYHGDWRAGALRSLVALWRRRGSVGVEDVDAVVPEHAVESDLRELVSDLRAAGVSVTVAEDERYGPGGASVVSLYFRDIGRQDLLGSGGEWRLARSFRRGMRRRVRAISRTVVGARVAVAACRAAAAGERPVHAVVVDEVGKRGREALSEAAGRAQSAIDACVQADAAAVQRVMFWLGRDAARGLVSGRARVRMSLAVQALGLCPAVFDEMVATAVRELSRVAAIVTDGEGTPRGRRRRVVPRRGVAGSDPAGLLDAAISRAGSGGRDAERAREQLIEMNLRLVVSFAKRMYRPDLGVSFPDLVQEGNVGLMKAVERFDPAQARFSTYAAWWIRQSMRKAIAETGRTVRIPVHVQERLADVAAVESEVARESGLRPGPVEVAERMGVDPAVVERLRLVPRQSVSVDAPVWMDDEESETWGSRLADPDAPDPEAQLRGLECRGVLLDVMQRELRGVEQAALCRRFGLADLADPAGARSLARMSRDRVRRLEMRALRKIQGSASVESLRGFLGADGAFGAVRG